MPADLIHSDPSQDSIRPIELDWYQCDQHDTIVVTPRDKQRFEIQTDHAIRILQVANEESLFQKQLQLLLTHLAGWIKLHREAIRNAYLTLQDSALAFVVVRTHPEYDAEFEDDLSELDFEIANDPALSLIRLHTLALPPVSAAGLLSFVDQRFVLSYHGN